MNFRIITFLSIFVCGHASRAFIAQECGLIFRSVPIVQLMETTIRPKTNDYSTGISFGMPMQNWVVGLGLSFAKENIFFETNRLQMRELKPSDSRTSILDRLEHSSFLIYWVGSKQFMTRYGIWLPSFALRALEVVKFGAFEDWKTVNYFLPVAEKVSGEIIGYVNWIRKDDTRVLLVGYGIFEKFRGQGYAKEALQGLVERLKQKYPDYVIRAIIDKTNEASIATVNSLGFYKVGNKKVGRNMYLVFSPAR